MSLLYGTDQLFLCEVSGMNPCIKRRAPQVNRIGATQKGGVKGFRGAGRT